MEALATTEVRASSELSSPDSDPQLERGSKAAQRAPPQKRPRATPYMPPHARRRRKEEVLWQKEKAEWRRRLEEEDAGVRKAQPTMPNVRTLAKKLEPWLEQHGTCRFNPLQKDQGVEVDDDGIHAECVGDSAVWLAAAAFAESNGAVESPAADGQRSPCAGPGVKGLPVIAGGRYHFEVELLCDSAVVVGWSAATSLPSAFDLQAFGYCPRGQLAHSGPTGGGGYGMPFGRAGDVVGALVEWPPAKRGPRISFALNGRLLGVAFDLGAELPPGIEPPPLQPHLCQAWGPAFRVLLRGASAAAPLRYPVRGFVPLGNSLEAHFCPFSAAVMQAVDVRLSASLQEEHLWAFQVPDSHVLELVYYPDGFDFDDDFAEDDEHMEEDDEENEALTEDLAWRLNLPRGCAVGPPAAAVRRSGMRTALACFRLRAHAERCLEVLGPRRATANAMWSAPEARPLREASEPSRRRLAEWRGAEFRAPGCAPTVARRLIHGSLGLQLPLSHLTQERGAAAARRAAAAARPTKLRVRLRRRLAAGEVPKIHEFMRARARNPAPF